MKLEEWRDDDWWEVLSPDDGGYQVSPQVVTAHVNRKDYREMEKETGDNSITYRIFDHREFSEDDPTQESWRMEYGVEYFFDGSCRPFVNYVPIDSGLENTKSREYTAKSISEDIWPALKNRTTQTKSRV